MIKYADFEEAVAAAAGDISNWRHILPAIPYAHRRRYLMTVQEGFEMPVAFDMVMASLTLYEDDYLKFLEEAMAVYLNKPVNHTPSSK